LDVVTKVGRLWAELGTARDAGRSVGLVPTMGALHAGHASLIRQAASECNVVVTTLFVNPLQFGPNEDLDSYPRSFEADQALAGVSGSTHLFAPSVAEMYPHRVLTTVRVAELTELLEGASRPGHFDGVTTVVAKLFAMAGRCRAYFGEKDFQQLAVIRRMAADLSFPVEVIGCRTVREEDGVALSSRNAYLSAAERSAAPVLYEALSVGKALVEQGATDPGAIRAAMADRVESEPLASLDYAAVVEPLSLATPDRLDGEVRLLLAARIGTTRLIDNLGALCAQPSQSSGTTPQGKEVQTCAGA
jgi:pantoate--beta-alanine ligase